MQLKAKTKSTESPRNQPHPGSQTYVGLLMPTHILWHKLYKTINNLLLLGIINRESPQKLVE